MPDNETTTERKSGGLGQFFGETLRTEKSGFMLMLLLFVFQFGMPFHGVLGWDGSMNWPMWAVLALAAFLMCLGAWYPNAQINGVRRAVSVRGAVDPQQANRDFGWSVLPIIPMIVSVLLTIVAVALIIAGNYFESFSGFNAPGNEWLRDRMIMSPTTTFIDLISYLMVRADLKNNNAILSELSQLAGRLMRFENPKQQY